MRGAVDGRRMVDFLFTLRRLRRQRYGGGGAETDEELLVNICTSTR